MPRFHLRESAPAGALTVLLIHGFRFLFLSNFVINSKVWRFAMLLLAIFVFCVFFVLSSALVLEILLFLC